MAHPKAYSPEQGYKYQILCRYPKYNGNTWEHCDYAKDAQERSYLLKNYQGSGYEFKTILLPRKYWK